MKLGTKLLITPEVMPSIMKHISHERELAEGRNTWLLLGRMLMHRLGLELPKSASEMELTLTADIKTEK